MRSEARALLAQLTEERGTDGVLKLDSQDGPDLPPGSTEYPPCQCPQHRTEATPTSPAASLSLKVRAVNERSQSGQA
ncbi:hypothetical protein GCM10017557_63630 [Streptomyces aurantiacus]|uniref:Uncharacterized protein n=1 Tax=Streptomyces aurantiacus TaxID=47760 RepID=A0A7G1PBV4_9ACTN|nr:hypothetical protein GCM10017557_63630 [Streptomyces aurantiacus]